MLRDYQERILQSTRDALKRGWKRPVIVAPTGSGKTHIATAIVEGCNQSGARTLFLAPRRELIYQTLEKFEDAGIESGMIMAGESQRLYAKHQVASFDTLHARAVQRDKIVMPACDVVIVDEAHLSLSPSKLNILNHYKDKIVIGLTATPIRSDGRGLGGFYDQMINEVSVRELIDEGFLVEPEYYAPESWDVSMVKKTRSDYVTSDLARAVDRPELIGGIYDNWKRIAGDKRTVIFCTNCNHSRHVRDEFIRRGIKAEHVDGNTERDERAGIFSRVRSGETQVLTNVYVASYGLEIPALECAVLARPTKSLGLYIQTCGRVLRPSPGKTNTIIIDHTGAVAEHGFLDDAVPWTLDSKTDIREAKKKQDEERHEPKEITCNNCGTVFKGQRECPRCGKALVPPSEPVPFKKAELKKIDKLDPITFYNMLHTYGKDMGFKPGWAKHQYRNKFNAWPTIEPRLETPSKEVIGYVKHSYIKWARSKLNPANQRRI